MQGKVEVLSSPEFKGQSLRFSTLLLTFDRYVNKLLSIFEIQPANFAKIIK